MFVIVITQNYYNTCTIKATPQYGFIFKFIIKTEEKKLPSVFNVTLKLNNKKKDKKRKKKAAQCICCDTRVNNNNKKQ